MDFFEAMSLMKQGERVRIKSWPRESFIGISEEEKKIFGKKIKRYTPIRENLQDFSMPVSFVALLQADWQVYEDISDDEDD